MSLRILFVDDEPGVLRTTARLLRRRRAASEAEFVESAVLALDALARDRFDVVVSDLAMPEMDGVSLLGEVRSRWPGAARLLLSGYSTVAHWQCTWPVAHQFLAKPCDDAALAAIFAKLERLRAGVADPAVVGDLTCLPSSPDVHARMTSLLQGELAPAMVAEAARDDVGLTAKILQLANSAFFALTEPVVSVAEAVELLGLEVLRPLLRSAACFRAGGADAVHVEARAEAETARRQAPAEDAEAAGTAALLRSAGKLLGGDARLGAYLLGLWGLPDQVVPG